MKINRQFQDLHSPGPNETDWYTIQILERDICLLYHQLADYSYIMGDLYYGNVFALSYWVESIWDIKQKIGLVSAEFHINGFEGLDCVFSVGNIQRENDYTSRQIFSF